MYTIEDGKVYVSEANVALYRVLTEFTSQTRKCTLLVLLCKTREATVRLRHSLELTRFWDLKCVRLVKFWDLLKLSLWHSTSHRKLLEVSCLMHLLPGKTKKILISLSNKKSQKDQILMIGKTLKDLGFIFVGT